MVSMIQTLQLYRCYQVSEMIGRCLLFLFGSKIMFRRIALESKKDAAKQLLRVFHPVTRIYLVESRATHASFVGISGGEGKGLSRMVIFGESSEHPSPFYALRARG